MYYIFGQVLDIKNRCRIPRSIVLKNEGLIPVRGHIEPTSRIYSINIALKKLVLELQQGTKG